MILTVAVAQVPAKEHRIHARARMVAEPGCDRLWRAPQEQTFEKICEQIVDVHGPQVVERTIGVPKISILQGTAEQILDVLVPEMVEQFADVPVPQVVEELV